MSEYKKLSQKLLSDLDSRSGFSTGSIDDDLMEDWEQDWAEIIEAELAQKDAQIRGLAEVLEESLEEIDALITEGIIHSPQRDTLKDIAQMLDKALPSDLLKRYKLEREIIKAAKRYSGQAKYNSTTDALKHGRAPHHEACMCQDCEIWKSVKALNEFEGK